MNKILKISLLAALVMVILGAVLAMTGRATGGKVQADEMYRNGELDLPFVGLPYGWNGRYYGEEYNHYDESSGDYDYDYDYEYGDYEDYGGITVGDSVDFDSSYPIHKADFKDTIPYSAASGNVEFLDVDTGGVGFYVRKSPDGNIHLEGVNVKKVQYFLEDSTLYIKALDRHNMEHMDKISDTATKVYLYLPDTCSFMDVVMEVGAGEAEISGIDTENITCSVGAGRLTFEELKATETYFELGMGALVLKGAAVENMNFDIGMGSMEYEGSIAGNVSGTCGMGNLSMRLEGYEKDHNYEAVTSMGTIIIGDNEFGGMSSEKSLDYGADSYFDLTSSMGKIEIYFTNPEG